MRETLRRRFNYLATLPPPGTAADALEHVPPQRQLGNDEGRVMSVRFVDGGIDRRPSGWNRTDGRVSVKSKRSVEWVRVDGIECTAPSSRSEPTQNDDRFGQSSIESCAY